MKATSGAIFSFSSSCSTSIQCCPTDSTTSDTSSTPNSVNSMSRIFMFLLLSNGRLGVQSCPGNFWIRGCLPRLRSSSRHLHEALQVARCHQQLEPDLCAVFSLSVPAYAIFVARLLRIAHRLLSVGFTFLA